MHYRWNGNCLHLRLRVSPKASRDKVGELIGDQLKISVTAPPVDGKANVHLLKLLAKAFGVAKSQVNLVTGETNRNKVFAIDAPQRLPLEFKVSR